MNDDAHGGNVSIYSTETVSMAGPTWDDMRRVVREFDAALRCTIGKTTAPISPRIAYERFRRTEAEWIAAEQRGWAFVAGARPLVPALALLATP